MENFAQNSKLKVVFFGTPLFAAEILRFLLEKGVNVVAVVTQPKCDRTSNDDVGALIQSLKPDIPLFRPEKASSEQFIKTLKEYNSDLFVVVAYGQILKQQLLDLPSFGAINVHGSILPKYRGAAPMQRALMAGEKESGITIIKMNSKMDAGDILSIGEMKISQEMNLEELQRGLVELAKPLLLRVIDNISKEAISFQKQDEALVTFAPKITVSDLEIAWDRDCKVVHDQIRALSPKPGARCKILLNGKEKILKILKAMPFLENGPLKKCVITKDGLVIFCKNGALQLLKVQVEGKNPMDINSFIRGIKEIIFF